MNGKKDRMITEIKEEGERERQTDKHTVGVGTVSGCGTCKPTVFCYVQSGKLCIYF